MRFVDTSFWVGSQVADDRRHRDAVALWRSSGEPVRTTNLVIGETWTFLNLKAGRRAALAFVDGIERSTRTSVKHVDPTIDSRAWDWLRDRSDRVYSYVDATSFEIMRKERISEALAFDGDFSAAGFVEVRPPRT
jgi:predicted nucleic acid-binding protein